MGVGGGLRTLGGQTLGSGGGLRAVVRGSWMGAVPLVCWWVSLMPASGSALLAPSLWLLSARGGCSSHACVQPSAPALGVPATLPSAQQRRPPRERPVPLLLPQGLMPPSTPA